VNEGLLDTNVLLHAHTSDQRADECRRFLSAVARGGETVVIDPLVAHEITYALPRLRKQMARVDVANYVLQVLTWTGVRGDKDLLAQAVRIWRDRPGVGFVDAFLLARALWENRPISSKNRRDLANQGADVPDPLPS
jgi:predicted nucleic acid-binding protein